MTYSAAYSVAKYVAAKTMAYDFVRHSFTRDINPGPLWLAVPAGLASAILFRAIVFPRRFEKRVTRADQRDLAWPGFYHRIYKMCLGVTR
jgi:hypothetical protein